MIATVLERDVDVELRKRRFETFYRSLRLEEGLATSVDTVTALAILRDPDDTVYLSKLAHSLFRLGQIVTEARTEGTDEVALNLFLSVAMAAIVPNPESIGQVQALSDNLLKTQREVKEKLLKADAAVKKYEAMTRVLRGLFHDLRTPVTTMKQSTYLLKRYVGMRISAAQNLAKAQPGMAAFITKIQTESTATPVPTDEKLIERGDMLDLQLDYLSELIGNAESLFQLQGAAGESTTQNLGVIVEAVSKQLQDQAQGKGLVLEVAALDKVEIVGDSFQLKRMLMNLVGNAIKYTDQGKVAVTMVIENGQVKISIQDTGPGMSAADQTRLFEPFFRSTRTSQKQGTGLGLVVVKEIAEKHGGSISVQSELEQGTTFTVTLPLKKAA